RAALLPVHRAVGGGARLLGRQGRARALAGAARGRDGGPERVPARGLRPGALDRLRLRHGDRPAGAAAPRRARPAPPVRERPALSGAVRVRLPLSWLADYVDHGLGAEALADRLFDTGTAIEAIERRGVPDLNGNLDAFRIGRVLEVGPHPCAD